MFSVHMMLRTRLPLEQLGPVVESMLHRVEAG